MTAQQSMETEIQRGREESGITALQASLAGKYMSFKLAAEEYGLEILKVREIIGLMAVTRVPKTAEFIRGVMKQGGQSA